MTLAIERDPHDVRQLDIHKQATVFRGAVAHWPAAKCWSPERFSRLDGTSIVQVKGFTKNGPITKPMTMREYADRIVTGNSNGLYLHDVPIFTQYPELIEDVGSLPFAILPKWYDKWWRYAQFFLGPDGSITPLHFDTLLTYNIFFHLHGEKTFTLIDWGHRDRCSRRGWRWFDFDPRESDFEVECRRRGVAYSQVRLTAGDVMIMPPGMLHHVQSHGPTTSFNIDFHTARSAVSSLTRSIGRAPTVNLRYTFVALCGQLGIFPNWANKVYAPYLSYVS